MSQNSLTTNSSVGKVRVTAGWDHPTGQVFCNVLTLDLDEDELDEDADLPDALLRMHYSSAQEIADTMKGANIVLPQSMIDAIAGDIENCARNVVRKFLDDGTLVSEMVF